MVFYCYHFGVILLRPDSFSEIKLSTLSTSLPCDHWLTTNIWHRLRFEMKLMLAYILSIKVSVNVIILLKYNRKLSSVSDHYLTFLEPPLLHSPLYLSLCPWSPEYPSLLCLAICRACSILTCFCRFLFLFILSKCDFCTLHSENIKRIRLSNVLMKFGD